MTSFRCGIYKEITQMNLQTERENELMVAGGVGGKDGEKGQLEQHVITALFEMDNQQVPTAEERELCSTLPGGLDGRELKGEWIQV